MQTLESSGQRMQAQRGMVRVGLQQRQRLGVLRLELRMALALSDLIPFLIHR